MRRSIHAAAAALFAIAAPLAAQDSARTVSPGRLVRVRPVHGSGIQGTVTRVDPDRLRIAVGGDTVTFAREEVRRVDLFQGTGSRVGRNALNGLMIGAAVGAIVGAASGGDSDHLFSYSPGEGALAFGLLFGALGAGVGALTGMHQRPIWTSVPLQKVFVTPAPAGGEGVAIGLHLRL